jgi:hypothetical protein
MGHYLFSDDWQSQISYNTADRRPPEIFQRAALQPGNAEVAFLFSKCLVEDAVVRHHGEPGHNGNKR